MPSRNRTRTIKGGPQGTDAVLEIIIPTVDENRAQQAVITQYQALAKEDESKVGEAQELIEVAAREYIASHVKFWNWVDDDGKELTLPSADYNVLGELIREELDFIAKALNGQVGEMGDTKKLVKKS